jgi:nucleotide-binding universal stress UspA family protein
MDHGPVCMEVVNAAILPGLPRVTWTLSGLVEGSAAVSGSGRVIVGVSESPGSLPALRYAEKLARREDAPLLAVHAWVPPGGDLAERRCPSNALRKAWQAAARRRLREALGAAWGCVPAGLHLQLITVRGDTGPALADVADSAADVLVVGAGRRGPLARIWHGRVSRYCVAHAVCPVITVPPPAMRARSLRRRELSLDHALSEWDGETLGRDRR